MSNKIPLNDHDISTHSFEDKEDTLKGKTGGDEYLREAGSEDESQAERFIKEYEKEQAALKTQQSEDLKSRIKSNTETPFDYETQLAETANEELRKLDWPDDWKAQAFATKGEPIYFDGNLVDTKYGLLIIVRDNKRHYSYRAFTISKDINVDYPAMRTLVSQAENMIDSYKKLLYLTNPRAEDEVINPISPKKQKKARK